MTRNSIKKFAALLLALSLLLSFAACKRQAGKGDETSSKILSETYESSTSSDDLTEETAFSTEVTSEEESTTGEEPSSQSATEDSQKAFSAPLGGSIEEIVAFYNENANATKEYKGKVTVYRKIGIPAQISKFAPGLKGILQGVLEKNLKTKEETKTFLAGKNPDDANDTLEKFLPRGKGKKMSELKAAGVKSATCEKEGDGYKVTIVLKREVVDDLDKHPPHHTSVMDPLTLDNDSLDPFTLGKGQVIYGQIEEPFDGARLTAKVNKNGVLDYL
ncbi:MAG TPA: hypothetical protein P5127_02190, partial [Oscillospiraceae bacterium]|nr:hypothetical protein [Oscillospiraceae bacterium]